MKEYGALHNAFQFEHHDSPVHRLGGGWKIIFALGFSAGAVAANSPWAMCALLAALVVLYGIARLGVAGIWADLRLFLVQIPIILALYLLKDGVAKGLAPGLREGFESCSFSCRAPFFSAPLKALRS